MRPGLEKIRDLWRSEWNSQLKSKILAGDQIDDDGANLVDFWNFKTRHEYEDTRQDLDRLCYWEPGKYWIRLNIYTASPDLHFYKKWTFELTEADAQGLRWNSDQVLRVSCSQEVNEYFFANVKYSSFEQER